MAQLDPNTSHTPRDTLPPSKAPAGSAPAEGVANYGDDLSRGCSAKTQRKFAEVLANIHFNRISPLLQDIRNKLERSNDGRPRTLTADSVMNLKEAPAQFHTCTVVQPPFNGFYNLVWRVNFSDGSSWALKIPRRGHHGEWTDLAAHTLITEARVMQLLKRETTIPVPDVYAYDAAVDNILGCPFIVMKWIDAVSLDNYWDVNAPFPEKLNQHQRCQLLQDLAGAVVQLDKFRFEQCGMPIFDTHGNIGRVGPAVFSDCEGYGGHIPPLVEAGPFEECQRYLDWKVERYASQSADEYEQGLVDSFCQFTAWMQETTTQPESFVLAHRDLGPQNVLINEEGRMCGIIDWEMAAILPECLGNGKNGSYPHWLTRDYDMFRGHASSTSTSNTCGVESALFDAEGELMRLDPIHASLEHFSTGRDSLFANFADDDGVDVEELEFYRNVWKLCIEHASLQASSQANNNTTLSVEDILDQVPRTYAGGLSPAQSLDARILMKAAEYPDANLDLVVTSIKRQITRVRTMHKLHVSDFDEDMLEDHMHFEDAVQCAYAEDGLPAMSIAIPASNSVIDLQAFALDTCHAVVPEYMTPPFSFEEGIIMPGMHSAPFPPSAELLTPPRSPSTTTDNPFTHDDSTIGTGEPSQASSASSPSLIAGQGADEEGLFRFDECMSILDGHSDGIEGLEELHIEQEIEDGKKAKAEELDLKPWFLYLYAGISPVKSTKAAAAATNAGGSA